MIVVLNKPILMNKYFINNDILQTSLYYSKSYPIDINYLINAIIRLFYSQLSINLF